MEPCRGGLRIRARVALMSTKRHGSLAHKREVYTGYGLHVHGGDADVRIQIEPGAYTYTEPDRAGAHTEGPFV